MTRYDVAPAGDTVDMVPSADGAFVTYDDALAAVAAERERCGVLTYDMLRYAMAAMGTGSPADADKFRLFWRFAIEARSTRA